MKVLSTFLASALLAVTAGAASAGTISSYGTVGTAPTGVINTALTSVGNTTYDIPTGGIWAAPIGNSSWVGINKGDYPGGGNVEPNGTYVYSTSFAATSDETATLSLMADDTTSVYLNGALILSPSTFTGAAHCVAGFPTCTATDTISFGGFTNGTNTLTFDVFQVYKNATGVDFSGTIGVTPEPSSLLLMGSGLTAMAGTFFRRRKQA